MAKALANPLAKSLAGALGSAFVRGLDRALAKALAKALAPALANALVGTGQGFVPAQDHGSGLGLGLVRDLDQYLFQGPRKGLGHWCGQGCFRIAFAKQS